MDQSLAVSVNQALSDDYQRLADYLHIETVSAQHRGINETVAFLKQSFEALGAIVQIFDEFEGNPFVFATFSAGPQGNANKTLLFYNHYDVQPPEPLDEWQTKPFDLAEVDGKYVARGVADDKGELMARLSAVKALQNAGGLPCNLKFIVEGEEEVGSLHVDQMTAAHAADLRANALVWETGGKDANEDFAITCGVKGIVSFELTVSTADVDLHSSLAAYADNAAWRLTKALASLRDADNHVLVDGFYDDIKPLTLSEQQAVHDMHFNGEKTKQAWGLKRPFVSTDPKMAIVNEPTMTINGLTSGYEGDGVKTVIPKFAKAKLDCRLVPGQEPQHIAELVAAQLVKNGFPDVKLQFLLGEQPFRSNLDASFIQQAATVAHEVYGDHVALVPNAAGGGPQAPFYDAVQVPIVAVGANWSGSGPHAPNESVRISDYAQDVLYTARLLQAFGKQ
ncbi:M20/M25/M40 family metallo-hydrolase [Secundilactobacillus folii]|uniref:M20/M25/M40 family metallo-hydrolase n=1 Tax=Secundilactobacillus folii TaxID=2678357 RepID=A0A7X2XUF8_9LACO|nr:M20/M25/M40 family metallo-hydrolase [Secundilactobacillus folii]MTV81878.1 M20/M25/M40 family metallo-hydrolase [Secundilactobacillus folii]